MRFTILTKVLHLIIWGWETFVTDICKIYTDSSVSFSCHFGAVIARFFVCHAKSLMVSEENLTFAKDILTIY